MLKKALISLVLIALFTAAHCAALGNITKINDLIENSATLDNTQVTIQGEVIGEALERGDYAWINITDTTNAIGIWIKTDDIGQIGFYGDYKHKGDVVKITGVFNKACAEHGGDVDIHCTAIEIVESGHNIAEQLPVNKVIIALALVLIALVMIAVFFRLKKRYES
jgi:Flp pilus assembly pilin Flp